MNSQHICEALSCGRGGCQCRHASRSGKGLVHCPSHANLGTPALSVGAGRSREIVLHCHNGCSQERVVSALKEMNLWTERLEVNEIRWDVLDAAGNVVATHVRRDRDGQKTYSWERNGSNGLKGMPAGDLPLYGSELIGGAKGVVVVEGEKSADALREIGIPAVATVCGAATAPSFKSLEVLLGKKVWLWPDNDDVGRRHMSQVEFLLRNMSDATYLIEWGEAPVKGDAADFLKLNPSKEAVIELIKSATSAVGDGAPLPEPGPEYETVINRGVVRVDWPSKQLQVEFSRLRQDRSGEPVADISVSCSAPGVPSLLHKAQLYMSSTGARRQLSEFLRTRAEALDCDWSELLETSILEAKAAFEEDDPPSVLGEGERPEGERFLIEPLILRDLPTLLFGDGGSGKSYLGMAVALSLQSGEPILGTTPTSTCRVAYLDWEMNKWEHQSRAKALCDDVDILYVPCGKRRLRDQVERLRKILGDNQIEYVIVDSIGPACGGDMSEDRTALEFFEALKNLEVGALLIAHVNRAGDTAKPFGSAFFHNMARLSWYAEAEKERQDGTLEIGLFNRKSNTTQKLSNLGFRLTFSPASDRISIKRFDVRNAPSLSNQLPLRERVYTSLMKGAMSYDELSAAVGAPVPELKALYHNDHSGAFTVITDGPGGIQRLALRAKPSLVSNLDQVEAMF